MRDLRSPAQEAERPAMQVADLTVDQRLDWEQAWCAFHDFNDRRFDAEALDALFARLTRGSGNSTWCLVARLNDRFAGMICGTVYSDAATPGRVGLFQCLYVFPKYRGYGVAGALMDRALDRARRRGATLVHWNTLSDEDASIRFYDRYACVVPVVRYERWT